MTQHLTVSLCVLLDRLPHLQIQPMLWDTTPQHFQVALRLWIDTKITVTSPGTYNFLFSFQLENTDNAQHEVSIWNKKNGTDIAYSNRLVTVPARKSASIYGYSVGSVNIDQEMDAGDYFESYWSTSSTLVNFHSTGAQTSPTRPETPCKVMSVEYIAPQAYSNIFVSSQSAGQATISHYANSTADKTYAYILVG
jgi:hypothetical protein